MDTIVGILLNPITLMVVGVILLLGAITSPYEIKFDESDEEIEI